MPYRGGYKGGRSVPFIHLGHLVWCPKYRKKIFERENVRERAEQLVREICDEYDYELMELEVSVDRDDEGAGNDTPKHLKKFQHYCQAMLFKKPRLSPLPLQRACWATNSCFFQPSCDPKSILYIQPLTSRKCITPDALQNFFHSSIGSSGLSTLNQWEFLYSPVGSNSSRQTCSKLSKPHDDPCIISKYGSRFSPES
jgi:hypothetical protein